jgi:hypothetical protein
MMGQLCVSAVLLVAAALAQAPRAEPPTGSRLGNRLKPGPYLTAKDQAVGAKTMADCMYDQNEKIARAALLAPNKDSADQALQRLTGNLYCSRIIPGNDLVEARIASFSTEVLRGMMAERALTKVRPQQAALPALALQNIYQRPWFAITGRHLSVDEMGACIADTNPVGITALIRTVPTTPEEGQAFASLAADMGKCLRAGTKLQANRQSLRAALAEALFQRLNAPTVEAAK